jgi:hypothetical protein
MRDGVMGYGLGDSAGSGVDLHRFAGDLYPQMTPASFVECQKFKLGLRMVNLLDSLAVKA